MSRPPCRSFSPRCESLETREVPAILAPITSAGSLDAVGDFNRDGLADLVVFDRDAATIAVRLGNGDGTFQPAGPAQHDLNMVGTVGVGDFNGDGRSDVLVRRGASSLAVLLGQGDGALLPPVTTTVKTQQGWIINANPRCHTADMNGDGRLDVVVVGGCFRAGGRARPTYSEHLIVLLARADDSGSFDISYSREVVGITESGRIRAHHVGDFNGDGMPDVLTVGTTSKLSVLRFGTGSGALTNGPNVSAFVNVDLTVADLNGDGRADAIRDDGNGNSSVFLGQGGGKFTKKKSVAAAGRPSVADVNRDGKADLIAVDAAAGRVKVLLGKGNGTFQPARSFAAGPAPQGVFVGDFNGDDWVDLVLESGDQPTVSVLLNNGAW